MAVYLVRHASAGNRRDGDADDLQRPLDDRGHAQAENLASMLADQAVVRVLSSPATRCVQTVERLASKLGLPVETDAALIEGAPIEHAHELLESVAGQPVVLCSHGDIIPDLIRRLAQRGMDVTTKKRGSAKGSVWVLDWDGERFSTGAYHRVLPDE